MKQNTGTTAFINFIGLLDDPFDAFEAALPPSPKLNDNYDPLKNCALFTLPLEIRHIIYDDLIESGNVNLLRAFKEFNTEGVKLSRLARRC